MDDIVFVYEIVIMGGFLDYDEEEELVVVFMLLNLFYMFLLF